MADSMNASENDLVRASLLAFPILLVALFFIFRGLRAALVPIIAALAAMATTFIPLLGVTHVTSLAPYATDVVMLPGLGLLMVNRFREARATGASVAGATERTLLGPANWWAPGPLRRLYRRIGLHEAPAAPARPQVSRPGLPAARTATAAVPHGSAGRELADAAARR